MFMSQLTSKTVFHSSRYEAPEKVMEAPSLNVFRKVDKHLPGCPDTAKEIGGRGGHWRPSVIL